MYRRFKYIQDWTIIGLFFLPPLIIGYYAGKNEIIRRSDVVTVDIVKDMDKILVYEHYEGKLVFEYNEKQETYKIFSLMIEKLD